MTISALTIKRIFRCLPIYLVIVLSFFSATVNAEISNQTLALLVNKSDPESLEIAEYYKRIRQIPEKNVFYVNFQSTGHSLSKAAFKQVYRHLEPQLSENIQGLVLAWRKPWRVGCMSITSAFSLGYDEAYCARGCKLTQAVAYFDSLSRSPYSDYSIRPSMLLSANSVSAVKRLIDRGVSADFSRPLGTAYLVQTRDKLRNVRSATYPLIKSNLSGLLNVEWLRVDSISERSDIMFYFTGAKQVKGIYDNAYLPGAIADHLTSTGGYLFGGKQMSILEWLDAGATGTYGTVVEPCNFTQKFPEPGVVMLNYLMGSTLLEAYWKSVKMPGQGLFVGEPLATPYKGCRVSNQGNKRLQYVRRRSENFVERVSRSCH